jgi:hypothetical protein
MELESMPISSVHGAEHSNYKAGAFVVFIRYINQPVLQLCSCHLPCCVD